MISPNLVTIPKTVDGQLKFIGGDQVLRTSTSTGGSDPRTRRSSRRPSWRIRRGFYQPPKQEVIAPKLLRKIFGKTCHELLQQADLRRLLQVKHIALVVLGLSTSSSSSSSTSPTMTPSRQEIDHPTSSSRSSTSPTMTSSIVSSDSVARKARGDL